MRDVTDVNKTTFQNKSLFWISALLGGIFFDLLFWEQSLGVNFVIFISIAVIAGLIPILSENVKVPWTSLILLIPTVYFAVMSFVRAEPTTTFMNIFFALSCLILFAMTLLNGKWYQFQLHEHIIHLFQFFLTSVAGGIFFFIRSKKGDPGPESAEDESIHEKKDRSIKRAAPYIRGLLLAIPILALFAVLFAQADPIFNDWVQETFSLFTFANLEEYLIRLTLVLLIAYGLLSTFFFAFTESKKIRASQEDKPLVKPFLGSIEANIILGGINLLFLLFVILQFSYLFNGGKNISATGYTYSEYARRGFFELLLVAVISMILFYVLSTITKREGHSKRWVFSSLGIALVSLVAIILVSAYTRLTLYEIAYGFTRLRTLAHIFMIWVALLLIAIAVLEIRKSLHRLAFILICFILGLGLTVNLLNIDRFIVQQNVTRMIQGVEVGAESVLDTGYLFSLSDDAIPKMVEYFTDSATPEGVRHEIGGVLACESYKSNTTQEKGWPSYHVSQSRRNTLLESLSRELASYPVTEDRYTLYVEVNGKVKTCDGYRYDPVD